MIHKVSYAISGQPDAGLIRNEDHLPELGDIVSIGDASFEVTGVVELIPPRGDWGYYHVSCVPLPKDD